jgi:SAM-dependent methyltransferase
MGVGFAAAKFILSGRKLGMKLDSVCTLGRQSLFMKASAVASLLATYHCCPADFWTVYPKNDASPIADALFQILGATRIDALDNSTYEGANVVHDLNKPLPIVLSEQYDLVLDAGTLEHIFYFPTALENAMRMVKPGGDIMFIKPANGLCGHGFYQFSPELFFRVLCPDYGFELLRFYLAINNTMYHVVDPLLVHGRVELRQGCASLFIHARKTGDFAGLSTPRVPQQSDYVTTWESREESQPKVDGKIKSLLRARLSPSTIETISRHLNRLRQRRLVWKWKHDAVASNRRFYKPVEEWDVLTRDATGTATRV